MNRNDLIALINSLLGGNEREAAERVAAILLDRHGRVELAADAVRAMDDADLYAMAA